MLLEIIPTTSGMFNTLVIYKGLDIIYSPYVKRLIVSKAGSTLEHIVWLGKLEKFISVEVIDIPSEKVIFTLSVVLIGKFVASSK